MVGSEEMEPSMGLGLIDPGFDSHGSNGQHGHEVILESSECQIPETSSARSVCSAYFPCSALV